MIMKTMMPLSDIGDSDEHNSQERNGVRALYMENILKGSLAANSFF